MAVLNIDLSELVDLYAKALESGNSSAIDAARTAVAEAAVAEAATIEMMANEAIAFQTLGK